MVALYDSGLLTETRGFHDNVMVALYDGGLRNRSLISVFMLFVVFNAATLILFCKKYILLHLNHYNYVVVS